MKDQEECHYCVEAMNEELLILREWIFNQWIFNYNTNLKIMKNGKGRLIKDIYLGMPSVNIKGKNPFDVLDEIYAGIPDD